MNSNRGLPKTLINVAMSADGKIAPASRQYQPFGSKLDHETLLALRATVDAVMCGASTINSFAMNLGPGGRRFRDERKKAGLAENNLRVVVSGSGSVNPDAEIFRHSFSPIIILTTERATERARKRLSDKGAIVEVCGEKEIDFPRALRWLRKEWKVKRLLCEGGGELNGALLHADLVSDIYVTICPIVLGGRTAPTLADGVGVAKLAEAKRLKIVHSKKVGAEMFLRYKVMPAVSKV